MSQIGVQRSRAKLIRHWRVVICPIERHFLTWSAGSSTPITIMTPACIWFKLSCKQKTVLFRFSISFVDTEKGGSGSLLSSKARLVGWTPVGRLNFGLQLLFQQKTARTTTPKDSTFPAVSSWLWFFFGVFKVPRALSSPVEISVFGDGESIP